MGHQAIALKTGCHQATALEFVMAKVAGHLSKLVWVVAAGYLLAKLLRSGAVSAAGREPDSTSKLVQDAPF